MKAAWMYKNPDDPRAKAAKRRYYDRNKAVYAAKLKQRKAKIRRTIYDYLCDHYCVDCGETDTVVLDFDHVRGNKKFNIANAAVKGVSLDTLAVEIEKCDIRCSNCHRRKTHRERRFIGA